MHGFNWGYRGMPRTGGFSCLNYFGSPLGFWLMIGFMVLLTVAIVLLVIGIRKKQSHSYGDTEALAIIQRRYAKGELTKEDFQRMKKDLH